MTAAEANRRQAEIWARYIQHENDLMRPISGDAVCQDYHKRVLAFCEQHGVNPMGQPKK
jgi:hypothetical protein